MTPSQLIQQLVTEGGAIVSSNVCSTLEIAHAQAVGRFAVDEDGMGFVLRYPEWLRKAMELVSQDSKPKDSPWKELHDRLLVGSRNIQNERDELKAALAEAKAEIEKGRQWNNLLNLELENLRSLKPTCYVCEQLMEAKGEDGTDFICVNCDGAYRDSQAQLRLCEQHAASMAKDFDASLAVVQGAHSNTIAENAKVVASLEAERELILSIAEKALGSMGRQVAAAINAGGELRAGLLPAANGQGMDSAFAQQLVCEFDRATSGLSSDTLATELAQAKQREAEQVALVARLHHFAGRMVASMHFSPCDGSQIEARNELEAALESMPSAAFAEALERELAKALKSAGVAAFAKERRRQIEKEDWSTEHDDAHTDGSLALAAICYAEPEMLAITTWPWGADDWKPSSDRLRNLAKAGAILAAEYDRLTRLQSETRKSLEAGK